MTSSSFKLAGLEGKTTNHKDEDYRTIMTKNKPLIIRNKILNHSTPSLHYKSLDEKMNDRFVKGKHSSKEMFMHKDIICLPCLCENSFNSFTSCEKNDMNLRNNGAKGHKIILLIKGKIISKKYYILEISKKIRLSLPSCNKSIEITATTIDNKEKLHLFLDNSFCLFKIVQKIGYKISIILKVLIVKKGRLEINTSYLNQILNKTKNPYKKNNENYRS